ncbi:hypothetical protein Q7C36_002243 [Tachysurus vachellii]|uniref:Uncharacterized protein n=1 Tax=Tachysurus vachellii TaxID=175792 RepID=A0AA88NXI6_TACVA|nr:hypothetical protein Q7C36_002243 [Tachysurus vachellii]
MSEKKKKKQCGTAGAAKASIMSTTSDQRPKCFRDIMDLVLHLRDEEWKAVSHGMTKEFTRVKFAVMCTKLVTLVSSAIVRRLLKPLSKSFGIEAIVKANDKLKEMESGKETELASAQKSPMEASDFICHLAKRIVTEIKGAMLEAIRSVASTPHVNLVEENQFSQLDDLSITCTNEICDKIVALYQSKDFSRPDEKNTLLMSLKSLLKVQKLMKGLEEAVSMSRSSSWNTISTVSQVTPPLSEVMTPECASSPPEPEVPFSDQFVSKALEMITEVLLRTDEKLAASVSSQTSVPASSKTELNSLTELAKSKATEILQKLFFLLHSCIDADQSVPEHEAFLAYAQKIHADIHKRVFTYVSERQQAVSEKSKKESDVAAKQVLDKATQDVSDILEKSLAAHISTGSISVTGLVSSTAAVDLDRVASGSVNKVISGVPQEIGLSDMERKPLPSDHYVPLSLFTVARKQLKAFFTSFSKRAAGDDKKIDVSAGTGDGTVHEQEVGPDSVPERSMLLSMQFPPELIYSFVEESTKALLQNVLNVWSSDGSDGSDGSNGSNGCSTHTAEGQEKKKRPRHRFVVKADRLVVVKSPKKQRKRRRDSLELADQPSTSDSHSVPKASQSVFERARRALGRFGSNISKTCTCFRNSQNTP